MLRVRGAQESPLSFAAASFAAASFAAASFSFSSMRALRTLAFIFAAARVLLGAFLSFSLSLSLMRTLRTLAFLFAASSAVGNEYKEASWLLRACTSAVLGLNSSNWATSEKCLS